jgi:2-enoate reductase
VTVVQRSSRFAKDLNKSVRWTLLESMEAAGVSSLANSTIQSIEPDAVVIATADGRSMRITCDTIVLAVGVSAENRLYDQVRTHMSDMPVYLIGDAAAPRQATEALLEGWRVANSL